MDLFKNFAKVTVSTGYDAAATSIVLSGGHGAKLPAAPFNATYWNSTDFADPTDDPNVEIVRVTAISTDTLTVTRGQEGITASTKNTASKTYRMIAGLTAKTLNEDSMSAIQASDGRLTLEAGVPISNTDQTAKTTIYFTQYQGNCISLYTGSAWMCHSFSELSLALGTLAADSNYDVFIYSNAGTLTLEFSAAWASAVARTDALALQDGIYVKSGATARRYLGTFRTTSTTTTEDSLIKRFVWNNANRVSRDMYKADATIHDYNGEARQWNNSATNQVAFVSGLAEEMSHVSIQNAGGSPTGVFLVSGLGLDSTTTIYRNSRQYTWHNLGVGSVAAEQCNSVGIAPQIGYHFIAALESSLTSGIAHYENFAINGIFVG